MTLILKQIEHGDIQAADKLLTLVYAELRKLAAAKMANEPSGQTLQPTALVHEVWLRLGGDQQPRWQNRAHFFGAAAESMRRILIDRARSRRALRHGGGQLREDLSAVDLAAPADDDRVLAVNDALERFAVVEPKMAELVKLRYYTGLTVDEAAQALGISVAKAKRWWTYSSVWLKAELMPP
ncbi:MAG: ECF-type sigma factor [Lacunisphaera sp.]|nr:ECF-type sigma factor [Lacunisphaera sp.]